MIRDYISAIPQYLLPKHALNRFAQFMANLRIPCVKNYLIEDFIKDYQVDMTEALQSDPRQYACFNDFFIRHLNPGARTMADAPIVSPVDGRISEIGFLNHGQLLQAKARHYSVAELFAHEPVYEQFQQGSFATLYLSPKDYHRVHMPIEGVLQETIYVPGTLFSVQPKTVRVIPNLFARNERFIAVFSTPLGLMALVLVGAAIVGHIGNSWEGDLAHSRKMRHIRYTDQEQIKLNKGDEMGYFKLGSTVIVLFSNRSHSQWLSNWQAGSPIRLGEALV